MNRISELCPWPEAFPEKGLCCLIRCAGKLQGVDGHSGDFCVFHPGEAVERTRPARTYEKITYCPERQGYYAIAQCAPGCVFVLDCFCREIDCFCIRPEELSGPMRDIWFDSDTGLLWVVTAFHIYGLSCNGDLLGVRMSAPKGTEYKALCTHGDFIFTAYVRRGCTYLASYSRQGVFLERMSLGSEYFVCNLQVFSKENGLYLHVYAIRSCQFPAVLEVELSSPEKNSGCQPEPSGGLCVECVSETPKIRSTCNIAGAR